MPQFVMLISMFLLISLDATHVSAQRSKNGQIVKQTADHTLTDRYEATICGIAFIQTESGSGTGFFINPEGDMVTASHVVSDKVFSQSPAGVNMNVTVAKQINVTVSGGQTVPIKRESVDLGDLSEASYDLAFIKTGIKPKCFIPLGNPSDLKVGSHLISVGYPGSDNGNPILYDGFLSGRFPHPPRPIATINGQAITPRYEVLKIQMPITPGASGSPVIDDEGKAIGVVSEAPMIWTQDLANITKIAFVGSGIRLSGFDTTAILGQLALVVREFETTGSGYAVPVSYLKNRQALAGQSSMQSH